MLKTLVIHILTDLGLLKNQVIKWIGVFKIYQKHELSSSCEVMLDMY